MPMRTAPERLLVRLEWRVIRRLDGRLAGGYRTAHRGTGTDLVGLREYTEGDDARHIDWNVTARLNEPQLRVFTEDRELTVWLVLDRSASMTVGPPGRGKHDVLGELALVLARLFGRGGNRVVALRVVDAADDKLPDVGLVVVEDAETGEQLIIDSSDPMLRTRLRARVEERDTGLAAGMRRAGVPIHRIGTDADLATALIEVVASTQRRRL